MAVLQGDKTQFYLLALTLKLGSWFYLLDDLCPKPLSLPMIQIGFLMNLNRPKNPIYFERQPELQSRITYSRLKNVTRQISIQKSVSLAKSS